MRILATAALLLVAYVSSAKAQAPAGCHGVRNEAPVLDLKPVP